MKKIWGGNVEKWKKFGEEKFVGESYGLKLVAQDFVNPKNGKAVEYSIVRKEEGVTVCAVTEEGNLILVRQYKQAADDIFYEFPAGLCDFSKGSILKSALMELRKETGYIPKEMAIIGEYHLMPRKSPAKEYLAIALGCKLAWTQDLDETEDAIEVFEMAFQEFWEMAESGRHLFSAFTKLAAFEAALQGYIPFKVKT